MIFSILKIWLCIFSLAGYSFTFKKYFDQRFGFSLLLSSITICCLSYLFSITFGNIFLPIKFFYFLGLLLLSSFLFCEFFQKNKNAKKNSLYDSVIAPNFISLLFVSAFIYYIFSPSYFHTWDEFTHWAISIKELYIKDRLFSLSDLENNYVSDGGYHYPPMTSIFFYFFLKNISSNFNEAETLVANSILLVLPIYFCLDFFSKKIINFKQWLLTLLCSIILLTLYVTLVLDYRFTTIYVDSILGAVFGVIATHNIFYNRNGRTNLIFFNVFLFFTTFFLTLVKDFGLFLSFITIPLIWLYKFDNEAGIIPKKKENWKINLFSTGLILMAIIVARASWQNVITNSFFTAQNLLSGRKIDFFALTEIQLKIIKSFINNWSGYLLFTETKVVEILTLICLSALFIKSFSREAKSRIALTLSYILLTYLTYSVILLYLYLTKFTEFESSYSASYERYLLTPIVGFVLILLASILGETSQIKLAFSNLPLRKKQFFLLVFFIILGASFSQVQKKVNYGIESIKSNIIRDIDKVTFAGRSDINRSQIKHESEMMVTHLKQGKKVLPLFHNFVYPQCYFLNYESAPYYPIKVMLDCALWLRGSYVANYGSLEKQRVKITGQKFSTYDAVINETVNFNFMTDLKNYDILFIPRADEALWRSIGYLFEGDYKNKKFFVQNSKGKLEPLKDESSTRE